MNEPAIQFASHRTVDAHLRRWRDRVDRRICAGDERRPPWDRALFLTEFWDDHPGDTRAVEFANAFEAAMKAAEVQGNVSRFEPELRRRLDL